MSWSASIHAVQGEFVLDVEIEGGERPVALIGPNGSGKSTLLRALTGVISQRSGEIVIDERVLFSSAKHVDVAVEDRNIGYVPQGYGLFEHLSVLDNVAFGLSTAARRVSRSERRTRAAAMLEQLQCAALGARRPTELSGGERQRVALARALILDPALLALDEPLGALDAEARRDIRRFLAAQLTGRPSVIVTHDVRDVIALNCDVFVMDHGRFVQSGTLEELRSNPANAFVEEFVFTP